MNYENVDTELSLKMHKLPSVGPFVCVCVSGGGGAGYFFWGGGVVGYTLRKDAQTTLCRSFCVCVWGGGGQGTFFWEGGGGGGRVHFAQGTT